jgi:hypothetical protein
VYVSKQIIIYLLFFIFNDQNRRVEKTSNHTKRKKPKHQAFCLKETNVLQSTRHTLLGGKVAKIHYSERQVQEFIEAASEMGISPAMRQLGYPTAWATAQRWFENAGVGMPTVDSLIAKAVELKQFYGDKEKKFAAMTLIDRIVESLHQDNLSPDDINKLGNALNKAIQTFNLIEGKSTSITESRQKDGTDLAIVDMLNEAKARNAVKEESITQLNDYHNKDN